MTALSDLKDFLHSEGRPRVWSLIVTLLGDVAEPNGGTIELQTMLTVFRALGIEDQAVRTALSRLVKDGLAESTRAGRRASYAFTPAARQTYRDAAQSVYQAPRDVSRWACAVLPQASQRGAWLGALDATHPLILGDALAVWEADSPQARMARQTAGLIWFTDPLADLPDWEVTHPRLNPQICDLLLTALDHLPADAPPDDAAALRVLVLHFWRRLVLRHPPIQTPLPDARWPLHALHRRIAAAYPQLVAASQATLGGPPRLPARFASGRRSCDTEALRK